MLVNGKQTVLVVLVRQTVVFDKIFKGHISEQLLLYENLKGLYFLQLPSWSRYTFIFKGAIYVSKMNCMHLQPMAQRKTVIAHEINKLYFTKK